ncbi:hypothetical protein VaNZ11_008864 [Volvox africanus]|uniref:Uncharacterized protein n=1 Tax=Volvox africanus TaxID=51714 RepID=A0ABQ5S6Q9_9CHLO|nr:hypothetical protein VaNZ11_008864 [Volvox africanus]
MEVHARSAVMPRWRIPAAEHATNLAFVILCLMSYQQLALPACRGQPHSLPADSSVFVSYPCGGSAPQRLSYVFRSAHLVLWDILHLKRGDAWVTYTSWAAGLRFLSAWLLPASIHAQVVAPFVVYLLRSSVILYHLLLGPGHQPSPLSIRGLFGSFMAYDVGFAVSFLCSWPLNTPTELAYGVASVAGRAILSHWYRDRLPGGINNIWQVAKQLLVLCTTLYLNQLLSIWRCHCITSSRSSNSASRARGTLRGDGDTAASCDGGSAHRMNNRKGKMMDAAEERVGLGMAELGDGDGWCGARRLEKLHSEENTAVAGGAVQLGPAVLSPRQQQDLGVSQLDLGCGVVAAGVCGTAVAGPSRASGAAADSADLHGGNDVDPIANRGAPQGVPQPPVGLPRYEPFIRRRTFVFKIPWAEPEQLHPGYKQRLRELVADRGYNMAAVYVRKGCVELTMVLEERGGRSRDECVADCPELRDHPHVGVEAVVQALGLMHLVEDLAEPKAERDAIEGAMRPGAGAQPGRSVLRLSQVEVKMVGIDYTEGVHGTHGSSKGQPDCSLSPSIPGAVHSFSCDCGFQMSCVCARIRVLLPQAPVQEDAQVGGTPELRGKALGTSCFLKRCQATTCRRAVDPSS